MANAQEHELHYPLGDALPIDQWQAGVNQAIDQVEQRSQQLEDWWSSLTPEQQATVQQFLQEKVKIRKELREVRYQLNADIEGLGRALKLVNIALVPLLLTLGVIVLWLWRRRRA